MDQTFCCGAISSDRTRVAAGSVNGAIVVFEVAATKMRPIFGMERAHAGPVRRIAFSSDASWIVSVGGERMFSALRWQDNCQQRHELRTPAWDVCVAGGVAAATSGDCLHSWDLATGIYSARGTDDDRSMPHRSCALSPNLRYAALGGTAGVRLLDRRGDFLHRADCGTGTGVRMAFSADEAMLSVGTDSGEVRVLDVSKAADRPRIDTVLTLPFPGISAPSPVRALAFTPGGDRLAVGYADGTVAELSILGGFRLLQRSFRAIWDITYDNEGRLMPIGPS